MYGVRLIFGLQPPEDVTFGEGNQQKLSERRLTDSSLLTAR